MSSKSDKNDKNEPTMDQLLIIAYKEIIANQKWQIEYNQERIEKIEIKNKELQLFRYVSFN